MLILKGVEVVCFDTLLQVLILKVDMGRSRLARETRRVDSGERKSRDAGKDNAPLEAWGKETQRAQSWRRDREEGGMPPRVFCKKSPQAIENKERRSEKERQEILRGGNLLKDRGLDEERSDGSVRVVRDNTRQGATDLDVCHSKLKFNRLNNVSGTQSPICHPPFSNFASSCLNAAKISMNPPGGIL